MFSSRPTTDQAPIKRAWLLKYRTAILFAKAKQPHTEELLYIMGQFGSEPDKVLIGDSEVSISSSTDNQIEIDLASLEEKLCGKVVVEHKGRKSNEHILSLWEQVISGEGRLEAGVPDSVAPDAKVNCEIAFRGEFLRERNAPDADPSPSRGEFGADIERSSSCTYTISGTYSTDEYIYSYDGFGEHSGTVQVSVTPDKYFIGVLATTDGEVRYQMGVGVKGQYRKTKISTADSTTYDAFYVIPLAITASIDEDGCIAEGQEAFENFIVEWQQADPAPRPDDNTAR
jgi:hypothetical protein